MGQKVNPINFRLQVHKNWSSRWFTANKKEFAEAIRQDHEIRELIEKKFASRPTINRIEIERSANLITAHGWAYGSTGTALHGKELGIGALTRRGRTP